MKNHLFGLCTSFFLATASFCTAAPEFSDEHLDVAQSVASKISEAFSDEALFLEGKGFLRSQIDVYVGQAKQQALLSQLKVLGNDVELDEKLKAEVSQFQATLDSYKVQHETHVETGDGQVSYEIHTELNYDKVSTEFWVELEAFFVSKGLFEEGSLSETQLLFMKEFTIKKYKEAYFNAQKLAQSFSEQELLALDMLYSSPEGYLIANKAVIFTFASLMEVLMVDESPAVLKELEESAPLPQWLISFIVENES